ncbi:MAG: hypothetical protein CVT49_07195 [candidate division Zixibacteria bacterium HGW-Zixibacteria-1]|nr:MAG: hypothetical protein CVT49_07195 [candidate division Zixibacteria bacterium HGW-Zixibacteria-1]
MKKNTVIILGTRHLSGIEYPEYHTRLKSIVLEIEPDIICAELSPEQLEGYTTCDSKPEQRDVIIPLAKDSRITIVPIQPPTEEGLARERAKAAIIDEILTDDKSRAIWEFIDKYTNYLGGFWREQMIYPECIENSQLSEFHSMNEALDMTIKHYFPKLHEYYISGNEYFLKKINQVIDRNTEKRILIVVGMGHKYWLWNRLIKIKSIDLHDLNSYRRIRKASNSSSE